MLDDNKDNNADDDGDIHNQASTGLLLLRKLTT